MFNIKEIFVGRGLCDFGSRDLRTAEIRHVDIWTVYGPKIYVPNFRGPKIAAPGLGGGGLNFSFRPKFRG